jgi:hypothetical protein
LLQETPELARCAQDLMRDLNGLLEDDRISPKDLEAIKALVCKWRFADASKATSVAIRAKAAAKREADTLSRAREHAEKLARHLSDPNTEALKWKFEWSAEQLTEYAELRVQLDQTIGLEEVKLWMLRQLNDAADCAALGEAGDRRNISHSVSGRRQRPPLLSDCCDCFGKPKSPASPKQLPRRSRGSQNYRALHLKLAIRRT